MGEPIRVTSLLGLNLSNVKNQIFSRTIYQHHPFTLAIKIIKISRYADHLN